MSSDYWNFVGNTNNQPRGYTAERLLKVPWYLLWLTGWWMMIAGLALNKRSSSSKVKQTLQRKLWNLLSVKATQRLKIHMPKPANLEPSFRSGWLFSKESPWSSLVTAIVAKDPDAPVLTSRDIASRSQHSIQRRDAALSCLPGKCKIPAQDWYIFDSVCSADSLLGASKWA